MCGGVIGVDAVDGEGRVAVSAHGEAEDGVGCAGVVLGELLLVVAAVPGTDLVINGGEGRKIGNAAAPPHGIASDAGVGARMIVKERGGLRCSAGNTERAGRRGAVGGVVNPGIVHPSGGGAVVLANVGNFDPKGDAGMAGIGAGVDNAVVAVVEPGGPVADGEGSGGGGGLGGGGSAPPVAAVEVSVFSPGIECKIEVILNDVISAKAGRIEGGLPILVVRARSEEHTSELQSPM